MPRREAQFAPGELAQAIEGPSKGGLFPLLASRKVMPPPVEIAERKQQKIGAYGTVPLRRRPYDMIPPGLTVDLYENLQHSSAREMLSNSLTFRMGDTGLEPVTSAV